MLLIQNVIEKKYNLYFEVYNLEVTFVPIILCIN